MNQLNNIVTTLLTLARSESIEYESIQLRSLLENCVLSSHPKLVDKEFNINFDVADDYKLQANKQLLILLVNNLIENAINHAIGNVLLVRLKNERLYFENKMSSIILSNDLNQLAEENIKQSSSTGFGQGLYLVRRIIESLGWEFEISRDNSTFQFVIDLSCRARL